MREFWPLARESERLAEHVDCFLRSAQENVRRPQSATRAENPPGALLLLRGVGELGVTQHPVDSVGSDGSSDNRECRTKRRGPIGGCHVKRPPLGRSDEPPRSDRVAEQHGHPGCRDRQLGVRFDLLVGTAVEPEPQRLDPPAACELVPVPERDPAGLREIAALVREGKRLLRASVRLAPSCCPLQVHGEQLRMTTIELRSEKITKQVVVAEPPAAIVERDDERIRAREGLKRIRGVVRAQHRIAQGWGHPVEDRRTEQEPLEIARLARNYLLQEIVGELLLCAGQFGSPRRGIVAVSQRQGCQRDRGSPPLRPLAQSLGRLLGQLETTEGGNGSRLLGVQCKERDPDLDQISTCTEAAEGHSRIATPDQHQLRAGWHLLREELDNRAAPLGSDEVNVVQHQHERVTLGKVGSQERKGDLDDPRGPSR